MSRHLSTLALHQLRYGELVGSRRRAALEHLETCPVCRRRLVFQERTREEFALRPAPAALPAPADAGPDGSFPER